MIGRRLRLEERCTTLVSVYPLATHLTLLPLFISSRHILIQTTTTAARTVRCRLPNVNQDTGEKHMQEPDKTMRSYRNIDAGSPKNACLGMQLVPADERSVLRVGEKLGIVETGEHLYIPLFS